MAKGRIEVAYSVEVREWVYMCIYMCMCGCDDRSPDSIPTTIQLWITLSSAPPPPSIHYRASTATSTWRRGARAAGCTWPRGRWYVSIGRSVSVGVGWGVSIGPPIGVGVLSSQPASQPPPTHPHISQNNPQTPPKQALLLLPPTAHNLALFEAWHACRDPPERFLPLLGTYAGSYVCTFILCVLNGVVVRKTQSIYLYPNTHKHSHGRPPPFNPWRGIRLLLLFRKRSGGRGGIVLLPPDSAERGACVHWSSYLPAITNGHAEMEQARHHNPPH